MMLCGMASVAGEEEGLSDALAKTGLLAALQGYLNWFVGPQR